MVAYLTTGSEMRPASWDAMNPHVTCAVQGKRTAADWPGSRSWVATLMLS